MTVRRALTILENQGLISGEKGRGMFARSLDLSDSTFRLDSPTGEWLDESAEIRLLSASMTRADEKVAAMLHVPPGERVIYLRRLVLYEGSPAMYHTEYITYDPRRPFVESQLQLTSLHAFLDSGRAQRFPRGELTLTRGEPRRGERRGPRAARGRAGPLSGARLPGERPHAGQLGMVPSARRAVPAAGAAGT